MVRVSSHAHPPAGQINIETFVGTKSSVRSVLDAVRAAYDVDNDRTYLPPRRRLWRARPIAPRSRDLAALRPAQPLDLGPSLGERALELLAPALLEVA